MRPLAILLFAATLGAEAPGPAALITRAGDGAAYLEWNPAPAEKLAGYHVYRRLAGEARFRRVTGAPLARPEYTDRPLLNGYRYEFAVTAVVDGGEESARSNVAEVRPRPSRAPIVETGPAGTLRVTFQYGHSIVLDTEAGRVRAWQAEDGTQLLNPLEGASIEVTRPDAPAAMRARYAGYTFRDNAIIFHWQFAAGEAGPQGDTWETWSPLSRRIGTAEYRGLERRIEIGLSAPHAGACVLRLNETLSPAGSVFAGDANVPFLFAAFPRGALVIAPRRFRRTVRALQPNIRIELPECGPRVSVESFEYLWCAGVHTEPRQLYLDAATYYRRRVAELYPGQPAPVTNGRSSPSLGVD